MADKNGHLEVLSLVRHLIEDYSELNTDVRTKRSQITADARRSFQQLRDMVPSGDWNGGFLEVIAFGEVEEQVYLGRELETVLDGLIARNRHSLVNFGRVVYHL